MFVFLWLVIAQSEKRLILQPRWMTFAYSTADIFDVVEAALKKVSSTLKAKCVGGGRIQHDAAEKKLKVYGYSQGYGKADHEVSVGILKKKYPDYNITWSDEGY